MAIDTHRDGLDAPNVARMVEAAREQVEEKVAEARRYKALADELLLKGKPLEAASYRYSMITAYEQAARLKWGDQYD